VKSAALNALFEKAGAGRWLSVDEFEQAVGASVDHAFAGSPPTSRDLDRYLSALHVADLALATACALGREAAWEHFIREHRPVLYRAADALDPSGGARDIADALYADLYGMGHGERAAASLFRYFHGRSSLSTWLRAVLSQRYVDRIRAGRRFEQLPETDPAAGFAPPPQPNDPDRERLVPLVERALRSAISELPAPDRLRLRSYHVAGMTLAQIGRLTREHEATVSRHLSRIRRELRATVEHRLRDVPLSAAQIARAFELTAQDAGELNLQQVFDAADRKESAPDRSK